MKRAYLTTAIALALSTAVGCSPASDQQPTSAEQNKIWPKLAQLRVNPRPIGRGYKREPRSGSILVYSDSAHTLSVFR